MRLGQLATIVILAGVIAGCGGGASTAVTVTLSPVNQTVVLAGTQQFSASVVGESNTTVTWQVCNQAPASNATGSSTVSGITLPTGCVTGGNATLGTVSTSGLYTAPATLPSPPVVSIVATSQAKTSAFAIVNVSLDTGIRVTVSPASVTIGTLEQFQFTATVSGSTNSAVNWSVNQIANGNSTVGTITPAACTARMPITPTPPSPATPGTSVACYTAPASAQGNVSVTATSAADSRQIASATVGVVAATDPSFSATPLEPSAAVEGLFQQDVYLFGSNFFSTNQILVNGAPVPTTFIGANTLRATIPAAFFTGPAPTSLSITVQRQNGDTSQPASLAVQPTHPAVIASMPDSFSSSTTSGTLSLNGGYFSSSTRVTSGTQTLPATLVSSRQLQVTLSAPNFPFSTPGLFPVLVQNTDVPNGSPSSASVNVAVAPSPTDIPPAPNPPIAVGTQPVAVAIDSALGTAVVVDHGASGSAGAVTLVNLDTNATTGTITVGNAPTSVGVDDILHLAAVVNSSDNTLSIVNLQSQAVTPFSLPANPTGTTPAPLPYSIGVNPLTHRAVVAYSNTNVAAVIDLSTNPPALVCVLGGSDASMANNCSTTPNTNTRPISTGPTPAIAVEPQLNWAVVTPGGSGSVTIVDLGMPATATQVARVPNVIASATLSTSVQGVAINTETEQALLTDPNQTALTLFSVLDQTVNTVSLTQGEVADAINPLTDVGVVLNSIAGTATVLDLRTLKQIGSSVVVGTSPQAVAIDAGKNVAVIANAGSNTVSILPLGPIRSPQITEVSPGTTFTASASGSLSVTVNGFGFASGSQVRLDGSSIPTTVSANGRQATATISGSLLAAPRRFSLDVMTPSGSTSNEKNFTVIGAIPIGLNPIAVAIDPDLGEALVTSQGALNPAGTCTGPGTVSVVNLSSVAVTNTFSVGTCPEGVAVLPRLGLGVVANNGSDDASVVDYVNNAVIATVSVGTSPAGVAIDPDLATVAVANSGSNTLSLFSIGPGSGRSTAVNVPVDQRPFGVSVDPIDGLAAVTATTQNTVDVVNLSSHFLTGRISNFEVPSDAAFDPISDTFLVADSLLNEVAVVDPNAFTSTPFRAGINPTAIAYNFQSGTGVTVDNATNTLSVFNFLATNQNSVLTIQASKVEFVLPMGGSAEFSVAIDPLTNVAAVVDQANGRLLLIPLPR
ncbi:MAG: hypothetical protein ACYDD2_09645 [Candidatus Acidiferrales bacterium]